MWQEMSTSTHRSFSNSFFTLLTFQVLKDFYGDHVEQKAEIQKEKVVWITLFHLIPILWSAY